MEIFTSRDARNLLNNKFVVIIGDSIQRGVYKDLIHFINSDDYVSEDSLRTKGEVSFMGDKLVEGGQFEDMTNRTTYREVRHYQTPFHMVRFYFVTRCYSEYLETILLDLSKPPAPDVVIMNSCLWDITRCGPAGYSMYHTNMTRLMTSFSRLLPEDTRLLWRGALPVSGRALGKALYYLPPDDLYADAAMFDLLPADLNVRDLVTAHGHVVVELYHQFKCLQHLRRPDGVHWNPLAHRLITNAIFGELVGGQWSNRQSHGPMLPPLMPPYDENVPPFDWDECTGPVNDQHGRFENFECSKWDQSTIPDFAGPVGDDPGMFENPQSPLLDQILIPELFGGDQNGMFEEDTPKSSASSEQLAPKSSPWDQTTPDVSDPLTNTEISADDEKQQEMIARYGGPINKPDYMKEPPPKDDTNLETRPQRRLPMDPNNQRFPNLSRRNHSRSLSWNPTRLVGRLTTPAANQPRIQNMLTKLRTVCKSLLNKYRGCQEEDAFPSNPGPTGPPWQAGTKRPLLQDLSWQQNGHNLPYLEEGFCNSGPINGVRPMKRRRGATRPFYM